MFAKYPIPQDSMVMEYRGETVRRGLADRREAAYRAAGKDCYLFALGDETVIDATLAGTIARFTVRTPFSYLIEYSSFFLLHASAKWLGCSHLATRPSSTPPGRHHRPLHGAFRCVLVGV